MASKRSFRPAAQLSGPARLLRFGRRGFTATAHLALSAALIALLAVGLVYLRLLQGPIAVPGLADLVADRVNAASEDVRVEADAAVVTFGESMVSSGIEFRGVTVRSVEGEPLLTTQRVVARFDLSDLLHGRVQPTVISLIEPEAQLIRTPEGRLRFGIGQGTGIALSGGGAASAAGLDAVAAIVDGFVGGRAPVPELARLQRVEIIGADLAYDDRMADADWASDDADVRIWRYDGGARATLEIEALSEGAPGAALRIAADRPAGSGRTELRMQFGRLSADDLARQSQSLEWATLIGGTVEGAASLAVERDGTVSALGGVLIAEHGAIRGLGEPVPFDVAQLDFTVDPDKERLQIESLALNAPGLDARLSGFAKIRRDGAGDLAGLDAQLGVGGLHLDMPEVFSEPLDFEGGRITARWSLEDETIEVVDASLHRGALTFVVDGQAKASADGWITDLRATATDITIDDLLAHWPLVSAVGARSWLAENILAGRIDRLVAQMRFGQGAPQMAVDFTYSDVVARYMRTMSPIEGAGGTAHLTFHDLYVEMEEGHVDPGPGQRIGLAGSSMKIVGFWGDVPPAVIALEARGETAAALALIDQDPLNLVSKLGLDIARVGGSAFVEADLVVPLLKSLRLADVQVEARARLTDVELPFSISPGRSVPVRAQELALVADPGAMRLTGSASVAGAPVEIDWREVYGGSPGRRTVALSGVAGEALLAAVGAEGLPLDGAPLFDLALRQTGGGPLAFELEADLEPVGISIGAIGWEKPGGAPGRLLAEGALDEGLAIQTLSLDTSSLDVAGSLRLDSGGRLVQARLDNVRLAGRADLAATLETGADGVLDVSLRGRMLDLSGELDRAGDDDDDPVDPARLAFDLDRLQLTDRIALEDVAGRISRNVAGSISGTIDGRLGPDAPVEIDLDLPADGPGGLQLTSTDAGAALRAAELYPGAYGGALTLDVTIGDDEPRTLTGRARIDDVTVRSSGTFRDVLHDGGLDTAEEAVSARGITFREVRVPFTYRSGVLELEDAVATSPLLALKVNGTVDAETDQLDLRGVLSPAYALTGALNEVPLIGELLGGEGEGVLAMTFSLSGPMRDPRFLVNPLSMLAPGFLRKVFTGETSEVSEDFRQRINRPDR